jgi:hypothetical protein
MRYHASVGVYEEEIVVFPALSCPLIQLYYWTHDGKHQMDIFFNYPDGFEQNRFTYDPRTLDAWVNHVSHDRPDISFSVAGHMPLLRQHLAVRRLEHFLPAIEKLARTDTYYDGLVQ